MPRNALLAVLALLAVAGVQRLATLESGQDGRALAAVLPESLKNPLTSRGGAQEFEQDDPILPASAESRQAALEELEQTDPVSGVPCEGVEAALALQRQMRAEAQARLETLRAKLERCNAQRAALVEDPSSPYGAFLLSKEAEQITDPALRVRLQDWLTQFPVFLRPGEALWIAERETLSDWNSFAYTSDLAVIRYLGPERLAAELPRPRLEALRAMWIDEGIFPRADPDLVVPSTAAPSLFVAAWAPVRGDPCAQVRAELAREVQQTLAAGQLGQELSLQAAECKWELDSLLAAPDSPYGVFLASAGPTVRENLALLESMQRWIEHYPVLLSAAETAWIADRDARSDWLEFAPTSDQAVIAFLGTTRLAQELPAWRLDELKQLWPEVGWPR